MAADAALAGRAQRGDIAAMAMLFERHRARLYTLAMALLRDRDEAADAVQDTFVTALTHITTLRDVDAVRGWLSVILKNSCRMRLRSRRALSVGPAELTGMSSLDAGPQELLEKAATHEWIWAGISSLTDDDQLTLVLRHFSRCTSYHAIAEATGVPVGTVRSRLHRAHRRLAERLKQVDSGPLHEHRQLERERFAAWEHFYDIVLEAPEIITYERMFDPGVTVREMGVLSLGVDAWVSQERPAIELGVHAKVVGIAVAADLTVLDIDFANPPEAPDHCPAQATFVHRLQRRAYHRPRHLLPLEGAVSRAVRR